MLSSCEEEGGDERGGGLAVGQREKRDLGAGIKLFRPPAPAGLAVSSHARRKERGPHSGGKLDRAPPKKERDLTRRDIGTSSRISSKDAHEMLP